MCLLGILLRRSTEFDGPLKPHVAVRGTAVFGSFNVGFTFTALEVAAWVWQGSLTGYLDLSRDQVHQVHANSPHFMFREGNINAKTKQNNERISWHLWPMSLLQALISQAPMLDQGRTSPTSGRCWKVRLHRILLVFLTCTILAPILLWTPMLD